LQYFLHALVAVVGVDLLHAQTEGDVLFHGHVGEQRVALEDHADVSLLRAQRNDVLAIKQNFPTVNRGQTGNAAQQRGLAAPGRAEQGDELAFGNFAVDIAKHGRTGVALLQVLDADEAHWLLSLFKILAAQVSTSTKKK